MKLNHPFLIGGRVYLRGLMRSDIDGPWFDWFNDQENTFFMYHGTYPTSYEEHLKFYQKVVESNDDLVLAICLKEDNRHVGNVGLHNINWLYRRAELGIIHGDRSTHGKGLGTEAMRLICGHGFNRLNLHKIYFRLEEANTAARRAVERVGFQTEGVLREEVYHHRAWRNSLYMGLLVSDFEAMEAERG